MISTSTFKFIYNIYSIFIVVLAAVSVAWIPIVQRGGELFNYIQNVTAFIAPPVCAVYVLALFWPRINEAGAFWALIVGFIIGIVRFVCNVCANLIALPNRRTFKSVLQNLSIISTIGKS